MLVGIRSTWAGIVSGSVTLLAMETPLCFLRSAESKPSRIGGRGKPLPYKSWAVPLRAARGRTLRKPGYCPSMW